MNLRTQIGRACFVSLLSLSLFLPACSSREDKAREAFENYQTALATGSATYIRATLLKLVAIEDGNPQYWMELGRVQLQLEAYPDAYYALVRAYELDRSNTDVLRILTQLALRSGDLDKAEEHAEQLSLLAPDDPAVKITHAYVALRRSNYDEAGRLADELLASSPYESGPKILKARVLLRTDRGDQAVRMLEQQVAQQPSDLDSLRALVGMLDRREDWRGVARYGNMLAAQTPEDADAALLTIRAALRSGDPETARRVSLAVLQPKLNLPITEAILDRWVRYGPDGGFVEDAARLAQGAPKPQQIIYAAYLNKAGAPDRAAPIVAGEAQLPVTAENADANAVLAMSLSLRGQFKQALQRFNQVLELDPNHAEALDGRARLLLRGGKLRQARLDAQRLVPLTPGDSSAHILLSDVYTAAGDGQQAGRVLWNAFHQISADRNIYEALRVFVSRTEGAEAVRRLDEEFGDQRDAELTREFI
jgi:predicted Zn-dependent protease